MQTNIKIKNCNNIVEGEISILEGHLNLKHALNGTGKSTISNAIKLNSEGSSLNSLKSFLSDNNPEIEFTNEFSNVSIFNEDFINDIVFNKEEVISDSFNIFIKTPEYDERRNSLNERLKNLRTNISDNEDIKNWYEHLSNVVKKITLNRDKSIKKNPFYKNLMKRNNLYNIPKELEKYSEFMHDEKNIEWIDWKSKGFNYDSKERCPFCTEKLVDNYQTEKEVFQKTYTKKTSQDLIIMLEFFTSLQPYINDSKYENLMKIIKTETDEKKLELELNKFVNETYFLKDKIEDILVFDSYKIKNSEIGELSKRVENLKISSTSLEIYTHDFSNSLITSIDQQLDIILNEVGILKRDVGKLNGYITSAIEKYEFDINSFLESAGISYEVDLIVNDENDAKTILKYKCHDNSCFDVKNIEHHLSWGEKNAFALMLFMHYSVYQNSDLIILDDPISSFDSNKKYAIINRLFKNTTKENTLYRKTVLMLTHDFEPIIDFVVNRKPTGGYLKASYLKNNNGILDEKFILDNEDILSITEMLSSNAKDTSLNIVHRVISLRKLIELSYSDYENAYHILSSLIHAKQTPDKKLGETSYCELSSSEITEGETFIKNYIPEFDYAYCLDNYYKEPYLISEYSIEENSYLKLQIFRVFLEISKSRNDIDDVVLKFVDNVYHVENDYTYCLNYNKFDIVPSYLIERIDAFMETKK